MPSLLVTINDLPSSPLDAAMHFHSSVLSKIREDLPDVTDVVVFFEMADHAHRAWRLAAIQSLAREAAPTRVNAIVGADRDASREVTEFLSAAPGITGQLLEVAGNGGERN